MAPQVTIGLQDSEGIQNRIDRLKELVPSLMDRPTDMHTVNDLQDGDSSTTCAVGSILEEPDQPKDENGNELETTLGCHEGCCGWSELHW